ncbi:hypothetical protein Scep_027353 [Stephania cephalantha]|uniref:Uncharacterized protein n=1 Tax=Stephania cephalantha TaxID=152367 RepID=A0AAP0E807_9MAGN
MRVQSCFSHCFVVKRNVLLNACIEGFTGYTKPKERYNKNKKRMERDQLRQGCLCGICD